MERFSYSSLETYKKCPAQFKFKYIDKIYKPDESVEAFMGKRIHEALEYLYNEVLDGRIPFFDHVIDQYRTNWDARWHTRIGIVYTDKSLDYYRNLGEDCIARYYRKQAPFEEPIVGNEIKLEFCLDNKDKYTIRGIIDRLDHDGNGNWEIHDYKSGKRALTQNQANSDNQLALYQLGLVSKEKDINSVKLVWHFLQHGVRIESTRNEVQLSTLSKRIKKQIDNINNQINNGGNFIAKESVLCKWCYYWEECPAQNGINPFIRKWKE